MNVLVIIHEYPYLFAVILIVMATIFNYLGTFICFVKAFVVAFMWDIVVAKSTALNMVTYTNLLDTCYRLARNLLEIFYSRRLACSMKASPFCMISPHVRNIHLSFLQRQHSLMLHRSIPRFVQGWSGPHL